MTSERELMDAKTKLEWPERLTLRDTQVYADEGQRIFTTATGYGYQKCEYVKAATVATEMALLKAKVSEFEIAAVKEMLHATEAEKLRRSIPVLYPRELLDDVERLKALVEETRFNATALKGLLEVNQKTIATLTAENERLSARVERLEKALKATRDDLNIRAVKGVVAVGNSVWEQINRELEEGK